MSFLKKHIWPAIANIDINMFAFVDTHGWPGAVIGSKQIFLNFFSPKRRAVQLVLYMSEGR